METIYVNSNNLRVGKVIADDIFANTKYPIIHKNTITSKEVLHVLQAFNIFKVPVLLEESENQLEQKDELINSEIKIEVPQPFMSFEKIYLDAVEEFKKVFFDWESGSKVDITKVRGIILPLIDKVLEERSILFKLNSLSNTKDYLYHHCLATGLISAIVTQKLGYERGFILQMAVAGTLADCGMAKIPHHIREKKGTLTEQEFLLIRQHPIFSFRMVESLPAMKEEMKLAIYQHHERLDGSGYVEGVKLGKISIFSQIIAVADTFHAMTSERVYRSKESPFKVIEMIKESEFGKFDIKVVQALVDLVAGLPIGTIIELSNQEIGEVMFINSFAPTRPLVKLVNKGDIIDLSKQRNIYISQVITDK
ncbi:HD-GYP domain-containing protein [Lysinibacillus sp. SGAir0095]|uniref:HD-GYP domain-containing protein n=1 Tax=Lysinibacillus sp. SGAir0095 TaxID=2070463 RepID=UPI0010CD13EF|nr:HD-GYP domain-containing protein [Lysinibacillus sp. SGAir0095]QCR30698.1 HD-GYP domain-containing protein [Lysinibacillus sp. SGAir0095]